MADLITPAGTKRCCRCLIEKPIEEFHNDRRRPSGKKPYCRECAFIANEKYRKKNVELAVPAPAYKHCSRCGLTKPIEEFYNCSTRKDGKQVYCRECTSEQGKEWYQANIDTIRPHRREYYAKNKDKWVTTPERNRRNGLKHFYKLTVEEFDAILAAQGGVCGSCGTADPAGPWHVDHNHACCPGSRSCGECVRGILCRKCNFMLGLANDDPDVLLSGAAYLERTARKVAA